MYESKNLYVPFVESVFHPSDFSEESEHAFAHALAISLARKAELTILHAEGKYHEINEWTKFPHVRATLERWGLLEKGSPRSAVFENLAIEVKKINVQGVSPLEASVDFLYRHPKDLVVIATHGREGLPRWIHPSVAERLARRSDTMALFVPSSTHGFVSLDDGHISLRRILIPVDHQPSPQSAIVYASRAAKMVGRPPVEITLIHVGDSNEMPVVDLPEDQLFSWKPLQKKGGVVEEIVRAAREFNVDMIAMVTQGHDGILDVLRGSVTEQVLRHSPCPLLAVPKSRASKIADGERAQ